MKKLFLIPVVFLCGCLSLGGADIFIARYALKSGDTLELYSHGGGATDVDDVWVLRKRKGQMDKDTVCNLLGFDEKYRFSFQQLDDSIILLTLHDTMPGFLFGDSIAQIINLNKKVITYPEHLPRDPASKRTKIDTL